MCEHCGCRGVEPIARLMDEHLALLELGGDVRRSLAAGDRAAAARSLDALAGLLGTHVRREERGVFAALRDEGDYLDAIDELEAEHLSFDADLATVDLADPDADPRRLEARVARLLAELSEHIDKENLGIFPVAVVTLGARGWETVGRAEQLEAEGSGTSAGRAAP